MNLFVSNIDYSVTEEDLQELFSKYGQVESVKILIDLESKKSKGYGFVLMADTDSGIVAIQNLDKMKLNGRPMSVQVARPRPEGGQQKPKPKEFKTKEGGRPYSGNDGGGPREVRSDDGQKFSKTGRKLRPRKPRQDFEE
jgi:RNA recognition motif-containing protein